MALIVIDTGYVSLVGVGCLANSGD